MRLPSIPPSSIVFLAGVVSASLAYSAWMWTTQATYESCLKEAALSSQGNVLAYRDLSEFCETREATRLDRSKPVKSGAHGLFEDLPDAAPTGSLSKVRELTDEEVFGVSSPAQGKRDPRQ